MKLSIIVLMFGCLFLVTGMCVAGEVVYDFGDANAWEVIAGDWEIVDGEYVSTGATDSVIALALLGDDFSIDTTDVEVIEYEAYDLGTGGWQNFFAVFGYDEANAVSYLTGPFVGGAQEWRVETFDPVTKGSRSKVAGVVDSLAPEVWYSVKALFQGDEVIVYGAERGEALAEKLRYAFPDGKPSGRVGLGASNSEVKFDNVKVSGESLASVDVNGKLAAVWGAIRHFSQE